MKIPTLDDFTQPDNRYDTHYSYKTDEIELTLEPCLNGLDVALYDLTGNLLYPKVCTNLKEWHTSLTAYKAAIPIYTKLLKQHEQTIKNRQDSQREPDNHSGQQ